MKLFSHWTDGNFQVFLFFIALITEVVLAILIYKYSPIPWCSYLVWNCMTFYVFGFSAIKQALAMSLIMWAFIYVLEEKPKKFLILTLLAGTIHMPALVFLPVYSLSKMKVTFNTILGYIIAGIMIYLFRSSLINAIGAIYYEEETFILNSSSLGGRFIMIAIIVLCGIVLKGFEEKNFSKLFHVMAIATICQMLSGFDNIFTRLTDYFFQFSVLYIPMLFSNNSVNTELDYNSEKAFLPFNDRSLRMMLIVVSIVLIWYYYQYCLSVDITIQTDDYLNFRFMWDVTG
ncbi:MAG: EpsG family protein [Lacrimispora saccharolytica]